MKATVYNFGLGYRWDCCYCYIISSMGPSGPVSLWFFRKVGYFQTDFEEKKGPGMTREDRGKGLSLILTMTGHPQIILPKLLQSLSGLLSSSTKVRPPSLQVLPSFCATCNVARVSEPQAIFTRNKNDLFQKSIAFQKHDGHTYNASCQSLAHCPWFNASR